MSGHKPKGCLVQGHSVRYEERQSWSYPVIGITDDGNVLVGAAKCEGVVDNMEPLLWCDTCKRLLYGEDIGTSADGWWAEDDESVNAASYRVDGLD